MVRGIVAIATVVLLSTTYATAQQQLIKECAADIRAACGDVAPGGGAIRSCLNSHLADLTRPCQVVLIGAATVASQCRADIASICANVQPGEGRIEACLLAHHTQLSPGCLDVMARTVGSGQKTTVRSAFASLLASVARDGAEALARSDALPWSTFHWAADQRSLWLEARPNEPHV